MAQILERTKSATLPSRSCMNSPKKDPLLRRVGSCKMGDFDNFELLYSGAVNKIKSHKSNLNLSKSVEINFTFICFFTVVSLHQQAVWGTMENLEG